MLASWSIRRVRSDDAALVAAHGAFQLSDVMRRAEYEAWVRPRIESGAYVGWFATMNELVVGGAGAVLLDWGPTRANPSGSMARIVNVYTDVRYRRNGIARTLVRTVLEHCEAAGVREFNLAASAEAQALYSSLGFESYPAEMRRRVS